MSNVYVISDLHLGHENMAIRRGFNNADEMNEHIIKPWNKVINYTPQLINNLNNENL